MIELEVRCEDGHMTLHGVKAPFGGQVEIFADCAVDLAANIAARYDLDEDEVFVALPTFGKDGTFPAQALSELIERTLVADKLVGEEANQWRDEKPTTNVGWGDVDAMDNTEEPFGA